MSRGSGSQVKITLTFTLTFAQHDEMLTVWRHIGTQTNRGESVHVVHLMLTLGIHARNGTVGKIFNVTSFFSLRSMYS